VKLGIDKMFKFCMTVKNCKRDKNDDSKNYGHLYTQYITYDFGIYLWL